MNDFTKEELICIRDNIVVPENHNDKSIVLMAYHKIMGMIDNFCESDEFAKEEQDILDKLKKPVITFEEVQEAMDEEAQVLGYENHKDLLTKIGWLNRFEVTNE